MTQSSVQNLLGQKVFLRIVSAFALLEAVVGALTAFIAMHYNLPAQTAAVAITAGVIGVLLFKLHESPIVKVLGVILLSSAFGYFVGECWDTQETQSALLGAQIACICVGISYGSKLLFAGLYLRTWLWSLADIVLFTMLAVAMSFFAHGFISEIESIKLLFALVVGLTPIYLQQVLMETRRSTIANAISCSGGIIMLCIDWVFNRCFNVDPHVYEDELQEELIER